MYRLRGLGALTLPQAIFRQEGSTDASGNWVPSSLGYRLNNPGNLNYAGQPGASPTTMGNGSEAQFATLDDGIAAVNAQLALDASRGLTLAQRLATWATGNQAAYLANVTSWMGGVDPNTPLSQLIGDPSTFPPAVSPPVASPVDASGVPVDPSSDSTDQSSSGLSGTVLLGLGVALVGILYGMAS